MRIRYLQKVAIFKDIGMQFIVDDAVDGNGHQYLQIPSPPISNIFFLGGYLDPSRASPDLIVDESVAFHQRTAAQRKVVAETELTDKANLSFLVICQL